MKIRWAGSLGLTLGLLAASVHAGENAFRSAVPIAVAGTPTPPLDPVACSSAVLGRPVAAAASQTGFSPAASLARPLPTHPAPQARTPAITDRHVIAASFDSGAMDTPRAVVRGQS